MRLKNCVVRSLNQTSWENGKCWSGWVAWNPEFGCDLFMVLRPCHVNVAQAGWWEAGGSQSTG